MGTSINSEMLVLAREVRGLTQGNLAKAAGIDQGQVSRYENGVREVSPVDLTRIATVLEMPESFFYRNRRVYGPEISGIYHRKRQSVPVKQLKAAYARLNIARMDIEGLLDGAEIESPYEFPRYSPDEYDVPTIAAHVRATWRLPAGPIPSVVNAIEDAGGIVLMTKLGTRKLDAVVQWIPPTPPVFLVNAEVPGDRLRFTLAHEIGHLVMHPGPTKDMEAEADAFAAAFLMPERDIAHELSPVRLERLAQLKPKWRVSIQALMRRALDLGKITERQYRALVLEFNKMGYRTAEPLPVPHEKPLLIKELLAVHMEQYGYSVEELVRILHMQAWEIQGLYLEQPRPRLVKRPVPLPVVSTRNVH